LFFGFYLQEGIEQATRDSEGETCSTTVENDTKKNKEYRALFGGESFFLWLFYVLSCVEAMKEKTFRE